MFMINITNKKCVHNKIDMQFCDAFLLLEIKYPNGKKG